MEYGLGYAYELEICSISSCCSNIIIDGEDNVFYSDMPLAEIVYRLRNKYPYLTRGDLLFIKEECF